MPFKTLSENRESSVYEASLGNAHILLNLRSASTLPTLMHNSRSAGSTRYYMQNSSSFEGKPVTSSSIIEYSH